MGNNGNEMEMKPRKGGKKPVGKRSAEFRTKGQIESDRAHWAKVGKSKDSRNYEISEPSSWTIDSDCPTDDLDNEHYHMDWTVVSEPAVDPVTGEHTAGRLSVGWRGGRRPIPTEAEILAGPELITVKNEDLNVRKLGEVVTGNANEILKSSNRSAGSDNQRIVLGERVELSYKGSGKNPLETERSLTDLHGNRVNVAETSMFSGIYGTMSGLPSASGNAVLTENNLRRLTNNHNTYCYGKKATVTTKCFR